MNKWIAFVKQYAKNNNLTYGEALKEAGQVYMKQYKPKQNSKRILQPVSNQTYWMFAKKYKIPKYKSIPIMDLRELIKEYEIDNDITDGLYF